MVVSDAHRENTNMATRKKFSPIGKLCIIRATSAGVHVGTVAAVDGDTVTLAGSQRLWHWYVAKMTGQVSSCSELAAYGIDRAKTKRAALLPHEVVLGVVEIIPCSKMAAETYRVD